jgi:hypothetical protein
MLRLCEVGDIESRKTGASEHKMHTTGNAAVVVMAVMAAFRQKLAARELRRE